MVDVVKKEQKKKPLNHHDGGCGRGYGTSVIPPRNGGKAVRVVSRSVSLPIYIRGLKVQIRRKKEPRSLLSLASYSKTGTLLLETHTRH